MAVTDFIAAIELSSTEISGIAGKKNADGIQILAYASERSSDCIKKGAIYNLDKTTQLLNSVIKQLEDQLEATIKKVYVGIGGLSVRSVRNTISKQLGEDTKISQALIDSLMQANKELPLSEQEILAVEPQEYKIGNNLQTKPVGILADNIEGHYLNIIARSALKSNLQHCFRSTVYEVADYFLSPLAVANVLLTNSEKRSGCALIDLGADTTTVSVYKNDILRHLAVIPLGGSNITKDICSLQIEEDDAEQIKRRFASAYTEPTEGEEELNKEYNLDGRCKIRASQLEDIVEARVSEIVENVKNQIMLSGYEDKLLSGIVLTGGGANMPNIEKAFTSVAPIEKIRIARSGEQTISGVVNLPQDGTQNTLVGLLLVGKDNCCKVDPNKPRDMFEENEEAIRLKQKEEEMKRAEAVRLQQLHEQKMQQEKERAEKRLKECDEYIAAATKLLEDKSYSAALVKLENARSMKIAERYDAIDELEEKIKIDKKKNSWINRFAERFGRFSDDILKDEK